METSYSEQDLMTFAQAMANVAASDGRVTDEERDELENLIRGIGLSPADEKVAALIDREFAQPGSLTAIVKGLGNRELRAALLRMMVEVSCADGALADAERGKVREAATVFGFGAPVADELIEWTLASIALEEREKTLMEKLLG